MQKNQQTAAILIIGNEILSGRTQDKNVQFIAEQLSNMGIVLAECRVVRDEESQIIESLNELRRKYTYLFTTGGIGPTHDDITAPSIAKAFNVGLTRSEEAVLMIKNHYKEMNKVLNPNSFIMADIPMGAKLVTNNLSGAPGFNIENVYVFAGVPAIAQEMFNNIAPDLKKGEPFSSKSIRIFVGESRVRGILIDVQNQFSNLQVGSYPSMSDGKSWLTTIVIRGQDPVSIEMASNTLMDILAKNEFEYKEESE